MRVGEVVDGEGHHRGGRPAQTAPRVSRTDTPALCPGDQRPAAGPTAPAASRSLAEVAAAGRPPGAISHTKPPSTGRCGRRRQRPRDGRPSAAGSGYPGSRGAEAIRKACHEATLPRGLERVSVVLPAYVADRVVWVDAVKESQCTPTRSRCDRDHLRRQPRLAGSQRVARPRPERRVRRRDQ